MCLLDSLFNIVICLFTWSRGCYLNERGEAGGGGLELAGWEGGWCCERSEVPRFQMSFWPFCR